MLLAMTTGSLSLGLSLRGEVVAILNLDNIMRQECFKTPVVIACLCIIILGAASALPAQAGETLNRIRDNKELRCGVTERLLGFSFQDERGEWHGFNVDFCRAVAVAVLGDAAKVSFTPLTAPNRFPALLSGRIDLLAHTVTWTFGREAGIGIKFPGVYFYDGQTFAVRVDQNIKRIEDLAGMTICVEKGTTLQKNLADTFEKRGIPYTPLVVDSQAELLEAMGAKRCRACTAERSVLAALRAAAPHGRDFAILPGEMSKEPLTPAVRRGDEDWLTLVRWVLFALIEAEERGVTNSNVRTLQKTTSDPELRWFLNSSGERAKALGLKPDWIADVIAAVGNYGEIYERNFGGTSGLGIDRGLNRLWKEGGLLIAPPFQ
jgi:general L-amino acid transport system substrate-binding protein